MNDKIIINGEPVTDFKKVTFELEIPAFKDPDQIHENLCKAIHEGDPDHFHSLREWVTDIKLVEPVNQ